MFTTVQRARASTRVCDLPPCRDVEPIFDHTCLSVLTARQSPDASLRI